MSFVFFTRHSLKILDETYREDQNNVEHRLLKMFRPERSAKRNHENRSTRQTDLNEKRSLNFDQEENSPVC